MLIFFRKEYVDIKHSEPSSLRPRPLSPRRVPRREALSRVRGRRRDLVVSWILSLFHLGSCGVLRCDGSRFCFSLMIWLIRSCVLCVASSPCSSPSPAPSSSSLLSSLGRRRSTTRCPTRPCPCAFDLLGCGRGGPAVLHPGTFYTIEVYVRRNRTTKDDASCSSSGAC